MLRSYAKSWKQSKSSYTKTQAIKHLGVGISTLSVVKMQAYFCRIKASEVSKTVLLRADLYGILKKNNKWSEENNNLQKT